MADLHPLVIVLLAIIGSVGAVAVGCALHRTLRPAEFAQPELENVSQEQSNFMHEVCARNRAEAFADARTPTVGGLSSGPDPRYSGVYSGVYTDGYSGTDYDNYSRV